MEVFGFPYSTEACHSLTTLARRGHNRWKPKSDHSHEAPDAPTVFYIHLLADSTVLASRCGWLVAFASFVPCSLAADTLLFAHTLCRCGLRRGTNWHKIRTA